MSTHSFMPCSKGSSMPRPTETPPARQAPLLAPSIAPGPPPVMTADPASASRLPTSMANAYSGSSWCTRAEPNTEMARPSSASAPKPSTNSDWIRRTRHGSACTQSVGPRVSSNRWSVVLRSTWLRRSVTGPLCVSRGRASSGAPSSGAVDSMAMLRRLSTPGRSELAVARDPLADDAQPRDLLGVEAVEDGRAYGGHVPGGGRDQRVPARVGEHRQGTAPVGGVTVPAYPTLLLQ